ncbi:MAG: tyrosine-type recombinase/integrase [Syntrophomonas sp.]
MEKTGLSSENLSFLNSRSISLPQEDNNGNKKGWAEMIQPYYQEIEDNYQVNERWSIETLLTTVVTSYNGASQYWAKKILNDYKLHVENVLGREIERQLDFIAPVVVEEIPNYLLSSKDKHTRGAIKRLYSYVCSQLGLMAAFDPLASRIFVYLQQRRKAYHPPKSTTGNAQIDLYLRYLKAKGISHNPCYDLMLFFRWIAHDEKGSSENYENLTCCNITWDNLIGYRSFLLKQIDKGILSPATVDKKWNRIKAFFKFAKSRKWVLPTFVLPELKLPKRNRPELEIYSDQEIDEIIQKFIMAKTNTMRDLTILLLTIDDGPRISELLNLRKRDIHRMNEIYAVTVSCKGSSRTIPLSPPATLILENYLNSIGNLNEDDYIFSDSNEQQASYASLQTKFYTKVKPKRRGAFHLFRHGYITSARENGADPYDIKDRVGHADLSQQEIYSHPRSSFLHDEGAKFPKLLDGVEQDD